jgi:hypothetical protein
MIWGWIFSLQISQFKAQILNKKLNFKNLVKKMQSLEKE